MFRRKLRDLFKCYSQLTHLRVFGNKIDLCLKAFLNV